MVVPLNAPSSSNNGRPYRFSRQFRLKSPRVIRAIMQDGASSRRRWDAFRLVWSSADMQSAQPKFAFVVSRDAGPAVARNRIKRRLREAVRLQRDAWPLTPTHVIIRVNEGKAAVIPFAELKREVQEGLSFAKLSTRTPVQNG